MDCEKCDKLRFAIDTREAAVEMVQCKLERVQAENAKLKKDYHLEAEYYLKEICDLRAKLAAAEHRATMLSAMVDEYQRDIIPGFRECAEKAERERDAERAHNAVLLEAIKANCSTCMGECRHCAITPALSATPSESAERVQKLVEALEWYADDDNYYSGDDGAWCGANAERDEGRKASAALADWRRGE